LCEFTEEYFDKYQTAQGEELVENNRLIFDVSLLPIVQRALYAEYKTTDGDGNGVVVRSNITNLKNDGTEESPKWAFNISANDGQVDLSFILPINAYWKSLATDLGSNVHRKNMYSLSVVVQPSKECEVFVGYTTRLRDRLAITAEGVNQFEFDDVSFEAYGEENALYQMFSFDAGGFISAYRQRVFERNFVYTQLMFACNSIGDCMVQEIAVEYTQTIKNIGVG
jgi:hypothetical protein